MDMASESATARKAPGIWHRMIAKQAFWVTIAVFLIPIAMTLVEPTFSAAFWKEENFFNVTRNFAFIAIIALGQVTVMITGGIDLSVGSVLAVSGIVLGPGDEPRLFLLDRLAGGDHCGRGLRILQRLSHLLSSPLALRGDPGHAQHRAQPRARHLQQQVLLPVRP